MLHNSFRTALALLTLASLTAAQEAVHYKPGGFGDSITGDLHAKAESDLFATEAVAGSKLVVNIGPVKGGPYGAALLIYAESLEPTPIDLFGTPTPNGLGFKSIPAVLPTTGRYGILIQVRTSGDPGEYVLSTTLRAPTRPTVEIAVPGPSSEAEAAFDALPGTLCSIQVRAAKDAALPTVDGLFDPEGDPVATTSKAGKTSVTLSATLSEFGRYALRLSGSGATTATVSVKLKPPRPVRHVFDVRDGTPPPAVLTDRNPFLQSLPMVMLPGESGGAETMPFFADDLPTFLFPSGLVPVRDQVVGDPDHPSAYHLTFTKDGAPDPTHDASVTDIVYDASLHVVGFAVNMTTPGGKGTTTFTGIGRDDEHRVTGLTETRTYGEGAGTRTWTLVIRGMVYDGAGRLTFYRLDATGPGLATSPFQFPFYMLPEK